MTRKTLPFNWKWLAVPGAVLATLALWTALGFPTIATGGQINELTRSQANIAIEVYNNKVRGLLRDKPLYTTAQQKAIWQQSYDKAGRELYGAEQQKINAPK